MQNDNTIQFENLKYGAYSLEYIQGSYTFNENVKYPGAEFNKLHVRKVRLPEGKGNIIYLLTDSFENSLKMVNGDNFIIPPRYTKFFYLFSLQKLICLLNLLSIYQLI